MGEEKDRFGNKMRDVEKAREDDYFARRDRELLDKLRKRDPESAPDADSGEKEKGGAVKPPPSETRSSCSLSQPWS